MFLPALSLLTPPVYPACLDRTQIYLPPRVTNRVGYTVFSLQSSLISTLAYLNIQSNHVLHRREHSFRDSAASCWVTLPLANGHRVDVDADATTFTNSQESDPTTNSRAVPIYATTVGLLSSFTPLLLSVYAILNSPFCSPSSLTPSMIPLTARGYSASKSSETFTVVL